MLPRDRSKEIFIDDIPEDKEDIMVEKMDDVKDCEKGGRFNDFGNTYISCNFNGQEVHMFSMKLIKPLNYLISLKKRYSVILMRRLL